MYYQQQPSSAMTNTEPRKATTVNPESQLCHDQNFGELRNRQQKETSNPCYLPICFFPFQFFKHYQKFPPLLSFEPFSLQKMSINMHYYTITFSMMHPKITGLLKPHYLSLGFPYSYLLVALQLPRPTRQIAIGILDSVFLFVPVTGKKTKPPQAEITRPRNNGTFQQIDNPMQEPENQQRKFVQHSPLVVSSPQSIHKPNRIACGGQMTSLMVWALKELIGIRDKEILSARGAHLCPSYIALGVTSPSPIL